MQNFAPFQENKFWKLYLFMDKLETAVSVKDDEERVHYSKPSVYILTCQRI